MGYVTLGRSGLKVSRACLGAMNFATTEPAPCNEAEAKRVIDAFLDAGNNFIDTANAYKGGESEEIVGRAVARKREQVVIATKAREAQGPGPNDVGLSRLHLTRALDASLKRLGTDYIDLYQMHYVDRDTPIEETMDTLAGFVRAGKVRYIGCSNFTAAQIVESQWAAEKHNGVPLISLQPGYSLIARDIETDILPTAERHGLGTLIHSPLGGGILSGKYQRGQSPAADSRYGRLGRLGQLTDRNFEIVAALEEVAAELGAAPSAVAVAWCLTRRGVNCVIIGPRTLEQLQDYLPAFELTLPEAAVRRLTDVSRPGGARPARS
jgi:aryl-alcohol dehydrogenase-like predicted oxidoreductase